jgi:hypothetical protein
VLLTGVTKFSQVSVFSDLNNLRDISMEDGYADICGITQEELEGVFAPEIAALAKKEGVTHEDILARMKRLYDGYHFSEESPDVYNPFSVLNTLAKQKFGMYWFKTGTPTFLIKLIEQSGFDVLEFQSAFRIESSEIDDFRIGQTNPVPVLYQSGYLTIKGHDASDGTLLLGFPNEEVESGFLKALLPMFTGGSADSRAFSAFRFKNDLAAGDTDAFLTRLKSLYASVPYSQKPRDEHYYQSIFYVVFTLMGQFVRVEERTYKGRSDAVVETADAVYVFEFKLVSGAVGADGASGAVGAVGAGDPPAGMYGEGGGRARAGDGADAGAGACGSVLRTTCAATVDHKMSDLLAAAMRQIDEGGYAEPHAASGKKVYRVAIVFSMEERNIACWAVA